MISFLDLKKVNSDLKKEILQVVHDILDSGRYILGKAVESFELSLKHFLSGASEGYAVGCNSGTDALILALYASGVRPGSEVITVSHTAIPTICAIRAVGAIPKFVDIDPKTWVMDTALVISALTPKTKAVIPVHLYGNMVNVNALMATLNMANRSDVVIIEDVAQAHGASIEGKQAGTLGRFGAFSFYPSKNIGAIGDGGAIYCHTKDDKEHLKMLRNYGQKDRYHAEISNGLNSRLDEIQAAILDIKLKYLNDWNYQKQCMMDVYRARLQDMPIKFQSVTRNCTPAWHLCVIALETEAVRDALMLYLQKKNVQTLIHYPIPNHRQRAFAQTNSAERLPVTENLAGRILSVPFNTSITKSEQETIIDAIGSFFKTS